MKEPGLITIVDDLWVFNKPAGYAAHPTGNPRIPDLLSWAICNLNVPKTLAPVHRLDRAVSGVILCSPDKKLRSRLAARFAAGDIKKEYRALVFGHTHKKGKIEHKLMDKRRGTHLEALTRYRRLESLGRITYLSVLPLTGRRHQIRRHLQRIGHPIIGDPRYKPAGRPRLAFSPKRLYLHAVRLTLDDHISFEVPLDGGFSEYLELWRKAKLAK